MGSPPSDSSRVSHTSLFHNHVMDSKLVISASLLVILAILPTGSGIQCHVCNSYEDAKCGDPFFFEGNKDQPKTREFIQTCPTGDGRDYFCRKIYQNVRGDERVIRSCGWEKNNKSECYATVLEEYNTYVCQCFENECNSASMFSISSLAVVSTLLMAYLMQ